MEIKERILISDLTTMRLGGLARYAIEIHSPEECIQAYEFASANMLPVYVLGGGSNVIGRDEGFDGVLLLNKLSGIEVLTDSAQELIIKAASGVELDALAEFATGCGWSGLEALSAIPGTIGGAVMQNVGAYGQEIADTLVSVEVYDKAVNCYAALEKNQLDLTYRHSIFNSCDKGCYFILSATIRLARNEIEGELFSSLQAYLDMNGISDRSPRTIRNAVIKIRTQKLPDPKVEASSGSFFKNVTISESECEALRERYPDIPIFHTRDSSRVSSGWLIEKCGLKGQLLHGMRVSSKSALILINESAGSYRNLAAARAEIVSAVQSRFGLTLDQEPEEIPVD